MPDELQIVANQLGGARRQAREDRVAQNVGGTLEGQRQALGRHLAQERAHRARVELAQVFEGEHRHAHVLGEVGDLGLDGLEHRPRDDLAGGVQNLRRPVDTVDADERLGVGRRQLVDERGHDLFEGLGGQFGQAPDAGDDRRLPFEGHGGEYGRRRSRRKARKNGARQLRRLLREQRRHRVGRRRLEPRQRARRALAEHLVRALLAERPHRQPAQVRQATSRHGHRARRTFEELFVNAVERVGRHLAHRGGHGAQLAQLGLRHLVDDGASHVFVEREQEENCLFGTREHIV